MFLHVPALLFLSSLPLLLASPTPAPALAPHAVENLPFPLITPSPAYRDHSRSLRNRRDILSDLSSVANDDIASVLSELGSDVPTYAASGVLPALQSFPTGTEVQSSLSLDDSQVAALPTQVLNLGPYANWTEQGWNMRLHGNVYKMPDISESKLDELADIFLVDVSINSLPASQQVQARNLTAEIFVIQQGNVQPLFTLAPTPTAGTQIIQTLYALYNTTDEGDYDAFQTISTEGLIAGNATTSIQTMPIYTNGTSSGNATAYLVPAQGLTIVSDIDDILRITKIYEPAQGLLNSFARPFTPWPGMPEVYANWSASLTDPQVHFHYLTTTPEQITRNYESFIYANYPAGSFDTRPLNFSNIDETLSVRKYLLQKIFATFPQRKFVLVGDTTNSDIMSDYPALAHSTDQVQCILLRNTSATDSGDKFPYDTSGFQGLNQSQYMFFITPEDLTGLDIAGGQCYNSSVKQNVTFGWQGLPFGLSDDLTSAAARSYLLNGWGVMSLLALVAAVAAQL